MGLTEREGEGNKFHTARGAWYKAYYSNASHNWAVYNHNDAFDVTNTAECTCTSYSTS